MVRCPLPNATQPDPSVISAAAERDLARAIARACYGEEPHVEALTRLNNLVFRLRFPGAWKVLKLAKGPDGAAIRKELMLIGLLARHAVPVPSVEHQDPEGSRVGRPYFVMASAGDRTAADWIGNPDDVPRRLFAEMGGVLARIHGITFEQSGDIRAEGIVPRDPALHLDALYRLADWLATERLLDAGEVALFESLPFPPVDGRQLCHGDFHAVQCIVRDGRIAAVVDWESAWVANPIIDFAITHAYLDFYSPPELIRCFVAGYAADRPLPPDYERAYLPVRMAHALGLIRAWRSRGPGAWRHALAHRKVEHAVELYRAYCCQWRAGGQA